MIGLKISDEIRFSAFINGKDSSPVIELLGSDDIGKSICSQLQGYNESYTEIKADKPVKNVKLEDKYYLAFDSLFSPTRLKLKDPFVNRLEDICIFVTIYELFSPGIGANAYAWPALAYGGGCVQPTARSDHSVL